MLLSGGLRLGNENSDVGNPCLTPPHRTGPATFLSCFVTWGPFLFLAWGGRKKAASARERVAPYAPFLPKSPDVLINAASSAAPSQTCIAVKQVEEKKKKTLSPQRTHLPDSENKMKLPVRRYLAKRLTFDNSLSRPSPVTARFPRP